MKPASISTAGIAASRSTAKRARRTPRSSTARSARQRFLHLVGQEQVQVVVPIAGERARARALPARIGGTRARWRQAIYLRALHGIAPGVGGIEVQTDKQVRACGASPAPGASAAR